MNNVYRKFLVNDRRKVSSMEGRNMLEETGSDRSRVVFSAPFRRLQQKAQVFSLEINSSVRSRLSHSLEVADYGRLIAIAVTERLSAKDLLDENQKLPFINIVETACLLHDIGNLPFGHFGETAIQEWFSLNWQGAAREVLKTSDVSSLELLINDFLEFDGNPQGFRIITTLQEPPGEYKGYAMNLTKSQLFSFLKYVRVANGSKDGTGVKKKPGFFNSEKFIVDELKKTFNHNGRFPLTYIMEAADDMSYCLSDIEDGVEKGIIYIRDFFDYIKDEWKKCSGSEFLPFDLLSIIDDGTRSPEERFFYFKIRVAQSLIKTAAETYLTRHEEILKGTADQLFDGESEAHLFLESLKSVAKKHLFRSKEAENNELAGHAVIYGLLEKFSPLLKLESEDFVRLVEFQNNPRGIKNAKKGRLDIELRLFNRLPRKYVHAYSYAVKNNPNGFHLDERSLEWFYRCHLIVDFIAGMTDLFSLNLYKLLHGIKIE